VTVTTQQSDINDCVVDCVKLFVHAAAGRYSRWDIATNDGHKPTSCRPTTNQPECAHCSSVCIVYI